MFGSYKKKCANPESDIGVAVVVSQIEKGKWFEWAKSFWHDVLQSRSA
jgi:predicted nucleotidyltransferase